MTDTAVVVQEKISPVTVAALGPTGPQGATGANGLNADGSVARTDVIYLAKHGDDANQGTTPDSAVLTLDEALTKANALTDGSNRVVIHILDAGVYVKSGSTTLDNDVHIYGPNATLTTRLVLRDETSVRLYRLLCDDHPFPGIKKNTGDFNVYIQIDEIDGRGPSGTNTGEDLIINDGSGILLVRTFRLFVPAGGRGIGDESSGFGHIHLYAADVYLAGDNAIGIDSNASSASIVGMIDHILETGNYTGTIGVRASTANSRIDMMIGEINCDTAIQISGAGSEINLTCSRVYGQSTAYDVSAGTLNLQTATLTGTRTQTGGNVGLFIASAGPVAQSPDGTWWVLNVANDGTVSASAL